MLDLENNRTTDSGRQGNGSSRLAETLEGRVNTLADGEIGRINEILEEKKSDEALVVEKISTARSDKDNESTHHTDKFERDDVTIVRRGQPFHLVVTFDRKIDDDNDIVRLQITYGKTPRESKGTLVRIPLKLQTTDNTTDSTQSWSVKQKITEKDGQKLVIFVTSPPDAFIGYYNIYIETKNKNLKDFSRTKYDKRIVILFNPWCEDDSVFMNKSEERDEYVLNEIGLIWKGSKFYNGPDPWIFGQYQKPVLSVALHLLERAELTDEARNNPIIISRKISAFVNSNDDNGILMGRWTETYPDGTTAPWDWIGSVDIIKQFYETSRPVKYGQCWVFSGVTTTLLRALGIPTRTVTNFASAHDHDVSMTIDKYLDEDGEVIRNLGDSVWNFHVWNESWFNRHDLPPGYDGWQVVDATPQESSGGVMQCGPAPVKAIKEGHVYLQFDIPFVYAEVNGDVLYWRKFKDGRPDEFVRINSNEVGGQISTKAVGLNARHDLTDQYRYRTGSAEETKVRAFISRFSTRRIEHIYKNHIKETEIQVDLQLPRNSIFGKDFPVHARIKNTASEKRDVSVVVTILHSYYTGVSAERVKTEKFTVSIEGNKEILRTIKVQFNEYKSIRNPDGSFQLFLTAKNESTKRTNVIEEIFILGKPDIGFEVPENVEFGKETKAVVKFKNITSMILTQCKFRIECIGVLDEVILQKPKLEVNEEWSETVVLQPYMKTGRKRELVAGFESHELVGIKGSSDVFTVVNLPPRIEEDEIIDIWSLFNEDLA